jgi:hypothetical protein
LFFVQPDGTAYHPETISRRFEQLVADARLPPIRLHDLRHCAATYLKAAGADMKDIQETLGHSSIAITGDTYTSVIHELETERAKADAASALVPPHQKQRLTAATDTPRTTFCGADDYHPPRRMFVLNEGRRSPSDTGQCALLKASTMDAGMRPRDDSSWPFFAAHSRIAWFWSRLERVTEASPRPRAGLRRSAPVRPTRVPAAM